IFKPVEGVEAEHKGMSLHLFDPHAYGIPYGYAPVLVANPELVNSETSVLPAFMKATARGYHFAAANPKEAARLLLATASFSHKPDTQLLEDQQSATAGYFLTHEGNWGTMNGDRWQEFA